MTTFMPMTTSTHTVMSMAVRTSLEQILLISQVICAPTAAAGGFFVGFAKPC
jgi:hypothetical protein